MGAKITRDIIEAYITCKTKARLKLSGQPGSVSDYEAMLAANRQEVRQQAIDKIIAKHSEGEVARDISLTTAAMRRGRSFLLEATLEDDLMSLRFDGLKRVDEPSKLGAFQYVPLLFYEGQKVGKEQRLLLELYGLALSRLQGQIPTSGYVWHGKECTTTRVRLGGDLRKTERLLREVTELVGAESPPRLILNNHCHVCEFHQRCHAEAVREDNISLLRGMGEKEVKGYARKGIFTVTQLAHTFRPRRKGKREVQRRNKRHHALQALAIRDKRIYIFGTPELPTIPVRIYLDVEGDPDEGYVYLIGMIVVQGDSERKHSFWADGKDQEGRIFEEFLAEVSKYETSLVFCYGSYERVFLQRMLKQAKRKDHVDKVLKALVNALSMIYSHFYFPTCSNGLKEIGGCLGFSWSEPDASGIQSIVWRKRWETTRSKQWKQKLTTYNLEDCAALKRVTEFIQAVSTWAKEGGRKPLEGSGVPEVALVHELDKAANISKWGKTRFVHPEFNYINDCAYFDYQRQRVFVRTSRTVRRRKKLRRGIQQNRRLRKSKSYIIVSTNCPSCGSSDLEAGSKAGAEAKRSRVKRAFDLVVTPTGVRRKVIECRSPVHRCQKCGNSFIPASYQNLARHFHNLQVWAMYLHVAHLMSFGTLEEVFKEMFGITVADTDIVMFKNLVAHKYQTTYRKLLERILSGQVVHIDETEVKLKAGKGYVWVFASLEEVVYMYRPTREGAFLQELLKDFRGVLVSDFYAAYDGIVCPQQKCLIHLIRDINQALLSNPFDEELRLITQSFGTILQSIVKSVDQHGLKKLKLKVHEGGIAKFFKMLTETSFSSDAAEDLKSRFLKYQEKLFTFIYYDGVPWNNNSAENAIKRFAYYREGTVGVLTEAGLNDYLVLLSIYQSCRYKGVSFLKFLLSRELDLDSFCEGKRSTKQFSLIEVYPDDFSSPQLAHLRGKMSKAKKHRNGDVPLSSSEKSH